MREKYKYHNDIIKGSSKGMSERQLAKAISKKYNIQITGQRIGQYRRKHGIAKIVKEIKL
jgi:hypothetical protein